MVKKRYWILSVLLVLILGALIYFIVQAKEKEKIYEMCVANKTSYSFSLTVLGLAEDACYDFVRSHNPIEVQHAKCTIKNFDRLKKSADPSVFRSLREACYRRGLWVSGQDSRLIYSCVIDTIFSIPLHRPLSNSVQIERACEFKFGEIGQKEHSECVLNKIIKEGIGANAGKYDGQCNKILRRKKND